MSSSIVNSSSFKTAPYNHIFVYILWNYCSVLFLCLHEGLVGFLLHLAQRPFGSMQTYEYESRETQIKTAI